MGCSKEEEEEEEEEKEEEEERKKEKDSFVPVSATRQHKDLPIRRESFDPFHSLSQELRLGIPG